MIKPEQLKLLAEYMEYEPYSIPRDAFVYYDKFNSNGENRYNPLENSDQCLELMEKLFINIEHIDGVVIAETMQQKRGIALGWAEAKTINEAVTLAAIAYVEGLNNE